MAFQTRKFLSDFGRVAFVFIGLFVYFTIVGTLFLMFEPSIPTAARRLVQEHTAALILFLTPYVLIAVFTLLVHFVWKHYSSSDLYWFERESFFIGYILFFCYQIFSSFHSDYPGETIILSLAFTAIIVWGLVAKKYLEPKLLGSYSSSYASPPYSSPSNPSNSGSPYILGKETDDD